MIQHPIQYRGKWMLIPQVENEQHRNETADNCIGQVMLWKKDFEVVEIRKFEPKVIQDCKALIKNMILVNPKQRPTATVVRCQIEKILVRKYTSI